jgi:hypothetical protein
MFDVVSDEISVLFHFAVFVFLQFQDETDIVVWVTRSNVQVEMKDGLSCNTTIVREKVESFQIESSNQCRGDNFCSIQKQRVALWFQLEEITKMFSWNDKGMAKMDGVDIENRYYLLIFKEDFRGNLTVDDFAENAIVHYSPRRFFKFGY